MRILLAEQRTQRSRDASAPTGPAPDVATPFVSVLMPVRNEEGAITACLESLLAQDYPRDRFEIVVMDGRSTDATRAQVRAMTLRDARVRLDDNPGAIVSTALNLGFTKVRGALVARADGHSRYAPDYLRAAVRAFEESGADVVGGPMLASWCESKFQRAVAAALASRFGMGGAAFHFDGVSGPAEAVYLGVYRADALLRFGPFDEHLVRDEDDEWFARARARGARVFLDSRIRSTYRPRANASHLLRQYFGYGLFKPTALRRVAGSARARHFVASALVLALIVPPLLGLPLVAAAAAALYGAAALLASRRAAPREDDESRARTLLRQIAVFALMHVGYGVGFLAGLLRHAPDDSHASLRSIYARYAASPRKRRAWSAAGRGQAAIVAERDAALAERLRARFGLRANQLRILDLGSGDRDLAEALTAQGIKPHVVVAADLLPERLAGNAAPRRVATDARLLPFREGSFDVVIQCTLLSSLRATAGRRVVAAEMLRVCRDGGLVLSYDARLQNPFNWNVRSLPRREHAELFAGCRVAFRPLTLLPPLARLAPRLAPWLARLLPLRAFDLAEIERTPLVENA